MPTIARGIYRWVFRRGATLENFSDRLNHFWTFGILLLFAVIIAWNQSLHNPMICWCPPEFTTNMVEYAQSRCWNSHYIKYSRDVMEVEEIYGESEYRFRPMEISDPPLIVVNMADDDVSVYSTTTTLYQWIPLILFFQALLFKLPNLLLYLFHGYSGLSFDKLAGLTQGYEQMNLAERKLLTRQISRYVYNWCNQVCNALPWRYLTIAWLLTKVMFMINIVTQMYYLDALIRPYDPSVNSTVPYGSAIQDNLFSNNGSLWKQSMAFPRQVSCEFSVRMMARLQMHTVQCDIPNNEFIEVAFMFLWVWFVFVALVTCTSLVVWMVLVTVPIFRERYVLRMLHVSEEFSGLTTNEIGPLTSWLGEDGVMALKLLGANSSELLVSDVICHMWGRKQEEIGRRIGPVPGTETPGLQPGLQPHPSTMQQQQYLQETPSQQQPGMYPSVSSEKGGVP